jgi:hypothetical protein
MFRPKLDRNQQQVFTHEIALDAWTPAAQNSTVVAPTASPATNGGEAMASMRELNLRFFKLTVSQRAAIAGRLGLLEDEDADEPDYERYQRVFMRARERQLIDQLETEVSAAEERKAGG